MLEDRAQRLLINNNTTKLIILIKKLTPMKKNIIILLFILINTYSFAQDTTDIKLYNDFLSEIRTELKIDVIQLANRALHSTKLRYDGQYDTYMKYLQGFIDVETLKEIVENSKLKPKYTSYFFKNPEKINAKIIDTNEIKAINKQNKTVISDSTNKYYYISLPVYDNNKQYAIVDFSESYSRKNFKGSYYLMKRINDKWRIIKAYNEYDSDVLSK